MLKSLLFAMTLALSTVTGLEIEDTTDTKPNYLMDSFIQVETMYADLNVIAHSEASKDSEVVAYIPVGTEVKSLGTMNEEWTRISYNNETAYVLTSFLTDEKPVVVVEEVKEVEEITVKEVPVIEPVVEEETVLSQSELQPTETIIQGVVQNSCEASTEFMNIVNSYYNSCPTYIRSTLETNGWQFKVITKADARAIAGGTVLGVTDTATKTVYIANRPNESNTTICHEIWHAYDRHMGWISTSSEFEAIYNAEVEAFKSYHSTHKANTNNVKEYFAEAGMMYIIDPSGLVANTPRTYEFLNLYAQNGGTF